MLASPIVGILLSLRHASATRRHLHEDYSFELHHGTRVHFASLGHLTRNKRTQKSQGHLYATQLKKKKEKKTHDWLHMSSSQPASKLNSSARSPLQFQVHASLNLSIRRNALLQLCHNLSSLVSSPSLKVVAFALVGFVNDKLFLVAPTVSLLLVL